MNINLEIKKLVRYGLENNLIEKEDEIFARNCILETLCLDDYEEVQDEIFEINLEEILKNILDFAVEKKLIENTIVHRDLFDTKLMSCLTPRPSEVVKIFQKNMKNHQKQQPCGITIFHKKQITSDATELKKILNGHVKQNMEFWI